VQPEPFLRSSCENTANADAPAPRQVLTAHILLAHGSRDPGWCVAIQTVAERIQQLDPAARACCAYLESAAPTLAAAVDGLLTEGVQTIAVWPMFLGLGRHVRADLPRLIAAAQTRVQASHPHVKLALQPAIAEHAQVLDAMAQVILHGPGR
jgi:sirohydrochlorin cobaltochelatase